MTSPHAPAAAALEQTAGIAPFPAQSIFERFQRVLPLWAHSPKPDITVGEVSEFLNIQLPSQHGRPGRKPVQPSQPSDNTPATGELSHMTTDNIPVPRVMPEYSAKNPATIEIADMRWPDGLHCPFCKSFDCINMELAKSPQPFQCRTCRRYFSTRTNSVLSVNSVPARFWIPLIRYVATNPVLPDPTLAATIAGTQVRQTERMMSAIADVLERWPHEPHQTLPTLNSPTCSISTFLANTRRRHQSNRFARKSPPHAPRSPQPTAVNRAQTLTTTTSQSITRHHARNQPHRAAQPRRIARPATHR